MFRTRAVLALLAFSLIGFSFATQYIAEHFAYDEALGRPLFAVAGHPIYAPWEWLYATWEWLVWSSRFGGVAPAAFRTSESFAFAGVVTGSAFCVLAALRTKRTEPSAAHGSSRWATTEEIRRAGLLRDAGVVLCQTNEAEFRTTVDANGKTKTTAPKLGPLVRHDGPEHVFCFAPTRSGKGVGLVIPTLLSWPHSVLVYDIKKEN